ncbi:PEP-CTERM sorting domain-containing protein [Moritella viscosa]|uniref:Ice-binding protein C-terminal domain-containing protein n=1 Tax=Moritella viscosa TaxID=80854 RepID=A0A1L0C073_9GAMM|nr:PEP-CTERM sorting domain-containing protein [Moritella viscosa]SGY99094.1 Putative uncharacterized protein [Moritella viscosa]SGZ06204.1 Putative uncharacterized protein [Moritella viscosa]SGZ06336.1 Putative uncharacterized protein [Moritella viscosa]SGZ13767.1 Putative uncharacterized protein [Moritella viscosa]SGZ18993.1 Putative uncharacterized protein [Moritella viscosa]
MKIIKLCRKAALLSCFLISGIANAGLINGSFEVPVIAGSNQMVAPAAMPGWETTDSAFEVWSSGFLGHPSHTGNQFVEINAYIAGTLSQVVSGISAAQEIGWEFAHRSRTGGVETMRLQITDLGIDNTFGTSDDTDLFNDTFAAGINTWQVNSGSGIFALGNDIKFAYSAVIGGSIGNLLDSASFGVGVASVPEPSTLAIFCLCILGLATRARKGV